MRADQNQIDPIPTITRMELAISVVLRWGVLASGVVIPNILMSTRGVFIVLISAALNSGQRFALDRQNRRFTWLLGILVGVAVLSIVGSAAAVLVVLTRMGK